MRARDNPFRSARADRLEYIFDSGGWEQIEASWDICNGLGAVVGAPGSGKTTFLRSLESRLKASGREVLRYRISHHQHVSWIDVGPEIWRHLQNRGDLLLDGAGILNHAWLRMLAMARPRQGRVMVSAHQPIRNIPTLHECRPGSDILNALVDRLQPGVDQCQLARLLGENAGNVRNVFSALYNGYSKS